MARRPDEVKWHWIDFVVELFGGLIPGLVCVAAMIAIAAPPLDALGRLVADHGNSPISTPANGWLSKEIIDSMSIPVLVLLFCIAYISGQIFFRQDPKEPDKRSFRLMRESKAKEMRSASPESLSQHLREEFACASEEECQFPYLSLGDYFRKRKLDHFLWFVTWEEAQRATPGEVKQKQATASTNDGRTKILINSLKIRLQMHAPEHYNSIARNEAHVRLASSTWYMCRMLMKSTAVVAALYLLLTLVLGVARIISPAWPGDYLRLIRPIIPSSVVFSLAFFMGRSTERFIHYQRLREIVFVVETAGFAFRDKPTLLHDLFPDYRPCNGEAYPRPEYVDKPQILAKSASGKVAATVVQAKVQAPKRSKARR